MISHQEILIRLLLGAVMGGLIGFERQAHGRPAGFRTHMLVCVSSVLIMVVSEYYYHLGVMDPSFVRVDPARIAAGAITGVGFLGAGVILKMGANISGLTTAASIWMVSAIGLALGAGLYFPATVSFCITIVALVVFRALESRMPRIVYRTLTVIGSGEVQEEELMSALKRQGVSPYGLDYEKDLESGDVTYRLSLALKSTAAAKAVMDDLAAIKNIRKIFIKS